jgi:hypothetical protein
VTPIDAAKYTVTVAGMSGTGTVKVAIPAGAATAITGGASSLASTSTDNTVTFDGVSPTVTINQASGQADPTDASPVRFTVAFSENVTGFTAADVDLSGSSLSGLSAAVTQISPSTYTVSVTGMSGNGTVVAKVLADAAADAAGNKSAASTSQDNSVTFGSLVQPTVTIDQAAAQADPTNGSSITYDVHFSQAVTGFDGSDVLFTGSTVGGTLAAEVSGSGSDYTVTVTGMAGRGNVVASVKAGAAVTSTGQGNKASTSTDNTVLFDGISPTVTINQAQGQADPTIVSSVQFDVTFSEPVTGFGQEDVSLAGSTAGGTLSVSVTGGAASYTVTVTGMTTSGLVVASIPADGAADGAGNKNLVSTSSDNSVEFLNKGIITFPEPVFTVSEEDVTKSVTVTVTRSGQTDGKVTIDYAIKDGTAHSGGPSATGQDDYDPAVSGTLVWEDGEGGERTFTIPIRDDGLNEGKELIQLALTNATGNPGLGLTTAHVAILPSDGQGPGRYVDQDGDRYRIVLAGKTGSLEYFRTDPDGDGKGPIELIELDGTLPDPTRPRAVLSVGVVRARTTVDGGTVGLGAITGPGLRAIVARKANLNLEGIDLSGYLGTLLIGNVQNGADISTGATLNPRQKTRINALAVGNGTDIDVEAHLASLVATSIGTGSLTAPSVGVMAVRGAMSADLDITGVGVDPAKRALGVLRVRGDVTGSDISVAGNVGAVVVGSFRDSRLFAGYEGADDGSGSFNVPATVTLFRTTGLFDGFQNSRVIGTMVQWVTIRSLDQTNDGNEFGFYADFGLSSVRVISPTRWVYNPAMPPPHGVGDFKVKVIE